MKKLSKREKNLIISCILLLVSSFLYINFFEPLTLGDDKEDEIKQRERLIVKTELAISRKPVHEKRLSEVYELRNEVSKHFLQGNKVPVAAAEIQKIVENFARKSSVTILSEKIMPAGDLDELRIVPVKITARGLVTNIRNMLFDIRSHSLHFNVVALEIRTVSRKKPKEIKASFIVEGVINTSKEETSKKVSAKNDNK